MKKNLDRQKRTNMTRRQIVKMLGNSKEISSACVSAYDAGCTIDEIAEILRKRLCPAC